MAHAHAAASAAALPMPAAQTPAHSFSEFTGTEYLMIDIATTFGLGKQDWSDRLSWAQDNLSRLEELVPLAKEPALYFAGVQALRKTQKGQPTGYPVSLDATASGLQILSALVGCEKSARLCNLVPTGHREDAYQSLYKALCGASNQKMTADQDNVKKACMTAFYGSTAVPKEVFGKGELLNQFYQTLATEAPGAWSLNLALQQLWKPYALSHDWVLPDNFHAHIKVVSSATNYVEFNNQPVAVYLSENQGTETGLSLCPNIAHSIDGMIVREMGLRCSYDAKQILKLLTMKTSRIARIGRKQDTLVKTLWQHYRDSGFLSARILNYLDEENIGLIDDQKPIFRLIQSLPNKPFPVLTNHDCFRVHPNHGNDLRRQYNRILSEIAGSDLLSFIASQIAGYHVPVGKAGDISQEVLGADYALS